MQPPDSAGTMTFRFTPEIVARATGRVIHSDVLTWHGELVGGTIRPASVRPAALVTSYSIPDSLVQKAVATYGFTAGANPVLVAPAVPLTAWSDTAIHVESGQTERVISAYGSGWGILQSVVRSVDGVLTSRAAFTWVALPYGGLRLSSVKVEDWSQPNVVLRYTITATVGNVTMLTDRSAPFRAAARACYTWMQPTRLEAQNPWPTPECNRAYDGFKSSMIKWMAASAILLVTWETPGGIVSAINWVSQSFAYYDAAREYDNSCGSGAKGQPKK